MGITEERQTTQPSAYHTTMRSASEPPTEGQSDHAENAENAPKKRGPKPGSEAAKHGGRATARRYGREFYSRIGRKGGATNRERHDKDFWREIGRKGGETTKQKHGEHYYKEIGRKGGHHSKRDKRPPE